MLSIASILETKASLAPVKQFLPTSFGKIIVLSPHGMAHNNTAVRTRASSKNCFRIIITIKGIIMSRMKLIKYVFLSSIKSFILNSDIIIPVSNILTGAIQFADLFTNISNTAGNRMFNIPQNTPGIIDKITGLRRLLKDIRLLVSMQYPNVYV